MLDYVLFAKLRYSFEFTIGIIKKVSLHPRLSIQTSVADGFGDVVALDILLTGEVGDGAGDLDDALVGSGGEVEVGHGTLQHLIAWSVELGVLMKQGGIHLGVAMDALDALVPLLLNLPRFDDTLTDGGRRLTLRCTRKLFKGHTRDFHMQVDSIQQRTTYLVEVSLDLARCACAGMGGVMMVATGAWIHGGDQHEGAG